MTEGGQRIDKWLFFARLAKSRSLAQKVVAAGAVRVNRDKIASPARLVRPGDVLTLSIHGRVRVLKILDGGVRRGPAPEAALLFEDLAPQPPSPAESADDHGGADDDGAAAGARGAGAQAAPRADGFRPPAGQPSSRDRRELARLKRGEPDG